MALAGTQDIQPVGAKRPRIRPVTLRFGRPMVFVEQPGVPPGRLRREVTDQIMDAIHAMSGQELAAGLQRAARGRLTEPAAVMAKRTRYVALLRAVNVGGRTVPMAVLRESLATLGYEDVRTYLQSGNAVFSAPGTEPSRLAPVIATALRERLGIDIPTAVLTAAELAAVVKANPFVAEAADPTRVVVSFLGSPVPPRSRRRSTSPTSPSAVSWGSGSSTCTTRTGRAGRSWCRRSSSDGSAGSGDRPQLADRPRAARHGADLTGRSRLSARRPSSDPC